MYLKQVVCYPVDALLIVAMQNANRNMIAIFLFTDERINLIVSSFFSLPLSSVLVDYLFTPIRYISSPRMTNNKAAHAARES